MTKKFNYLLTALLLMPFSLFYSCSSEDDLISNSEEIIAEAKTNMLLLDSLKLGDALDLEVTDELKELVEKMKQQIQTRAASYSYDDYDDNFSTNMWAIRELPFTLKARSGGNTGNLYLTTNGKRKEVTMTNKVSNNAQKFYVRVLPASSGIPYILYSYQEKTPLVVGYWNSDPNRKMLMPDSEDKISYFTSWDFPQTSYSGYYAIQNLGYIGQADPNNSWSIFYHVLQVNNNNVLGYGQYKQQASQEFLLKPDANFIITEIAFDEGSAKHTELTPLKITTTDRNDNWYPTVKDVRFANTQREESRFNEKKTIAFNLLSYRFGRPTVEANKVVLPRPSTVSDISYAAGTQYVNKSLSFSKKVDAPERSLIQATAFIKNYSIEIRYTAKGVYQDREIKLSGTWRGTVYLAPNIAEPTITTRFFDLDTGEEIFVYSRSSKKQTVK